MAALHVSAQHCNTICFCRLQATCSRVRDALTVASSSASMSPAAGFRIEVRMLTGGRGLVLVTQRSAQEEVGVYER